MKAEQRTFSELVDGQRQLLVPLYQRPYSWTKKERATLVEDVIERFEDAESQESHFLGSVVLAPSADNSLVGFQRLLVVDGQQRMTSLYIFILAIRDRFRALEQDGDAEKTNDIYLINRHEEGDLRPKVLPTQLDREALKHLVDGTNRPAGFSEILNAYQEFSSIVRDFEHAELTKLLSVITSRMEIIAISLSRDDNTFRIFESLNDKGLTLTQGDLLRNHVFMMLPTQGEYVHRTMWADIEENIGSEFIEDLAYLDMVMRGSPTLSKKNTYQAQKTRLMRRGADENDVVDFIRDLRRRSGYFRNILFPETHSNPAISRALRRIKRLGNETVYPLALFLLEGHGESRIGDDEVVLAIHYAESFLVRRTLAGLTAAGLNRLFTRMPQELDFGEPVASRVRAILSRPQYRWPSDEELRENATRERLYNVSRNPVLRHVLLGLEESYGHKELGFLAPEALTIEHVLPQNPPATWDAPVLTIDGIDPEMQLHCLGNLTLTGYNQEMGNNTFAKKRAVLRSSKLALNIEISRYESWGSRQILDRAIELADRVSVLWAGPAITGGQKASEMQVAPFSASAPVRGTTSVPIPRSTPSPAPSRQTRQRVAAKPTRRPERTQAPLASTYSGSIPAHVRESLNRVKIGEYLTTQQICAMESSAFKRRGLTRAVLENWLDSEGSESPEFWVERTSTRVTLYRIQ